MKKIKEVLSLLSILFGVLNFCLFCFWNRIAHTKCGFPLQESWRDPIAIQFSIMNIMLICVTIFLVVIGFFGYFGIKSYAESKAEEIAKSVAERLIGEFLTRLEQKEERGEKISSPTTSPITIHEDQIKPEKSNL